MTPYGWLNFRSLICTSSIINFCSSPFSRRTATVNMEDLASGCRHKLCHNYNWRHLRSTQIHLSKDVGFRWRLPASVPAFPFSSFFSPYSSGFFFLPPPPPFSFFLLEFTASILFSFSLLPRNPPHPHSPIIFVPFFL